MRTRSIKQIAVVAGLSAVLAACSSDLDELRQRIAEIRAKPGDRIEPIPELKPPSVFTYDAGGLRSPFVPSPPSSSSLASSLRPEKDRAREYLETFPLDSLRMVGTVEMKGKRHGLVKDINGLVHFAVPGQYLGQNQGKIVSVSPSKISVVEVVEDGVGGFIERQGALPLSE